MRLKQKYLFRGIAVAALGFTVGAAVITFREFRQDGLDCSLILALRSKNGVSAKSLLQQGANPNTVDRPCEVIPTRSLVRYYWDRWMRRPGNASHSSRLMAIQSYYRRPDDRPDPPEDRDLIGALLAHGVDVNAADDQGMSPLAYAAQCNHASTVRLLLDHGADPNVRDESDTTPLFTAGYQASIELVRRGANVNARAGEGLTPLEANLVRFGDRRKIQLLLQHGADASVQDSSGFSAGGAALLYEDGEMLRLLCEHGLRVDQRDFGGRTLLMLASGARAYNPSASIRCLLNHGAIAALRDKNGKSALDYAIDSGDKERIDLVRAACQKQAAGHGHVTGSLRNE